MRSVSMCSLARALAAPVLTALLVLVAAPAAADSILPTAFGKGIDWDDPLDGAADELTTSISTQDLTLNATADPEDELIREDRGIYEFDLGVAAPLGVSSATLELPIYDAVTAVGAIRVYAYAGNGALDFSDFSQTGNLLGSPAIVIPVTSLDVTAAVQAILGRGDPIVGFLIALTAENQLLSIWNPGETANDPRLVFTPIPEPTTVALLGAGIALLVGTNVRRLLLER